MDEKNTKTTLDEIKARVNKVLLKEEEETLTYVTASLPDSNNCMMVRLNTDNKCIFLETLNKICKEFGDELGALTPIDRYTLDLYIIVKK